VARRPAVVLGSWIPGPVNDMVVDGTGAAYVGNFGFDLLGGEAPQPTALLRVAPDGEVRVGVAPDGICLDAEGQVWVATARAPEVLRVAPGGQVTGRVQVGSGSLAFACALGGDDGRTLFVCTAPTFRPGGPRAGRVEVARVEVPAA
jgi:sugar lactone lactonase YvrE